MLRLLRLIERKYVLMPLTNGGPQRRVSSPRGGGSTLTTVAPMSPSIIVQNGPERIRDRSSTKMLSSGVTRAEIKPRSDGFRDQSSPKTTQQTIAPTTLIDSPHAMS